MTLKEYNLRALLLAIRRDEHGIRAKDRYFSPRNIDFKWDYQDQPPELWDLYKSKIDAEEHFRIHPLLHWTELDIWEYIYREKIPIVNLYFAKKGKRYRSIGCERCCASIESKADSIRNLLIHATIVNLISNTRTKAGLNVRCVLDRKNYPREIKVTDEQMASIKITRDNFHGGWNYTIHSQ